MAEKKSEIVVKKELAVQASPAEQALQMLQSGATPEQLDKILDLQLKYEANDARKQFNSAMVEVHKNVTSVKKTLENKQTHSTYASLDNIISHTKKVYTEQGFSIMFYEGKPDFEGHIRVCADVIHSAGHKESYHYDVPLDGVGIKGNANMTKIHGKASSVSYGRRYLMCMIWNIPTGDDDDGNSSGVEVISEKQQSTILDYLDLAPERKPKFLAHFKIESVGELPASRYNEAMIALKAGGK